MNILKFSAAILLISSPLFAHAGEIYVLSKSVVRGPQPNEPKDVQKLKEMGITDVVIFKKDTQSSNVKETAALIQAGMHPSKILEIPFPWKDMPEFQTVCQMTVAALERIRQVELAGGRTYFHCSMGEDRTGYLAGLYRLAAGQSKNITEVFQKEMCDRGYEAGNPNKPVGTVVMAIRRGLTPAYLILAKRILKYGYSPKICAMPLTESISDQEKSAFICHRPSKQ